MALAAVRAIDGFVVALAAAHRGQRAYRLHEVRVGEVGGDRVARDHRGGGGHGLLKGPLRLVGGKSRLPRDAQDPRLALVAVGVPRRLGQRVSACGEGGGEDLPQCERGGAVLADRVGLLGYVRDARPLQQHRMRERLDARLRHAEFLSHLGGRGAGTDARLNLVGAQVNGVCLGVLSGGPTRFARGRHDGAQAGGALRLRSGAIRLTCVARGGIHVLLVLRRGGGLVGGWSGCRIAGGLEHRAKLVGDLEEELLAVLGPQDERGVS